MSIAEDHQKMNERKKELRRLNPTAHWIDIECQVQREFHGEKIHQMIGDAAHQVDG